MRPARKQRVQKLLLAAETGEGHPGKRTELCQTRKRAHEDGCPEEVVAERPRGKEEPRAEALQA